MISKLDSILPLTNISMNVSLKKNISLKMKMPKNLMIVKAPKSIGKMERMSQKEFRRKSKKIRKQAKLGM